MDRVDRWIHRTEQAGQLAGQLAQVQAELVTLTAELLADGGWAGDGVRSPAHWLQVYTGLSPAQATHLVHVAERVEGLAPVVAMMGQGRLTLDQAAPIAAHVPDHAVAEVADLAERATVTQLRRVTATYPFERPRPPHEEPRTPPDAEPARLTMSTTNGRFQLRFDCPAIDGATLEQAVREAKDHLFTTGNTHATLADGLLHVATQSLAAVSPASRRDGYRVLIHLDTDGTGWLGRTGALPSTLLDAYTCDGTIRPVWHTDGVPVAVGRSMRIVPRRTRRLIEDRDQGCRYPGCPATGFLENHHLIHWNQGGDTDPPNLLSLCPYHHRSHHLGDYQISGDPTRPDGLTFTTAHGHPIQPVHRDTPPVMPERPAPIRDVVRGEQLESWSVQFRPPPDADPDLTHDLELNTDPEPEPLAAATTVAPPPAPAHDAPAPAPDAPASAPEAAPSLPERPDDVDPDNWAILMRIHARAHAYN